MAWASRRDVVIGPAFYLGPHILRPLLGGVVRDGLLAPGATLGGRRPNRPLRTPEQAKSLGVLVLGRESEEFGAGRVGFHQVGAAPGLKRDPGRGACFWF